MFRSLLPFAIASLVTGCGSTKAPPAATTDAGVDATKSDGESGDGESGDGAATTCREPAATPNLRVRACSFSDSVATDDRFALDGLGAWTDCTSSYVYLALSAKAGTELRRYTLKSAEPCVLERDTTFTPPTNSFGMSDLQVDGRGGLYVGSYGITRIAPEPAVECTGDAKGKPLVLMAVDHPGARAYGSDFAGVLTATFTGGKCAMVSTTLTDRGVAQIKAMAVDARGRLHIGGLDASSNSRIEAFEGNARVLTYANGDDRPFSTEAMAACGAGVCAVDRAEVWAFTAAGTTAGKVTWTEDDTAFPRLASNALGHVFVGASVTTTTGSRAVVALIDGL